MLTFFASLWWIFRILKRRKHIFQLKIGNIIYKIVVGFVSTNFISHNSNRINNWRHFCNIPSAYKKALLFKKNKLKIKFIFNLFFLHLFNKCEKTQTLLKKNTLILTYSHAQIKKKLTGLKIVRFLTLILNVKSEK